MTTQTTVIMEEFKVDYSRESYMVEGKRSNCQFMNQNTPCKALFLRTTIKVLLSEA